MQAMDGHSHHAMETTADGMVMNQNLDRLPRDCPELAGEVRVEINAGAHYAEPYPAETFAYDLAEIEVPPCSLVNVTFHNHDDVRHQWMVHGLPSYLYPGGMFHLEANGGATVSGGFIVPSDDRTYLVHCDLAQHMEKGMKAQLVVGHGSGDLWAIPGLSADFTPDDYLQPGAGLWIGLALTVGVLLSVTVSAVRARSKLK